MTIKAGDAGIWVTCDMHKEGVCTAECKDLFNEVWYNFNRISLGD